MRRWLASALAAWAVPAAALPVAVNPVPGGIAMVRIATPGDTPPEVLFGARRLAVVHDGGSWNALVGLPADLAPGQYIVTLRGTAARAAPIQFNVHAPAPPAPDASLTDTAPNKSRAEVPATLPAKLIHSLRSAWRATPALDMPFLAPVKAAPTRGFGTPTLTPTAGSARNLVYALPAGIAVRAPAAGLILPAPARPDAAAPVLIIDHGRGLFSIFTGLAATDIKAGTAVKRGQSLAHTEATPLTWSVVLNGVEVDPRDLLSASERRCLLSTATLR